MGEQLDRLKSLALFSDLSEAQRADLDRFLGVQSLAPGEVVFEEGSAGEAMYLVAEGQVRIEKRAEAGGYRQLARLSPGDFFGEMALLEETPRSARAVAATAATLFVLSRGDLRQWLASDSLMAVGFFVALLRVDSQRLRRTSEDLVLLYDLSHLSVQQYDDESSFLGIALAQMLPHLPEGWSLGAYLGTPYTNDARRVATAGPEGVALPETMPLMGSDTGWLDGETFRVGLPGDDLLPVGFLIARNPNPMADRDRAVFEVALTAVAQLLSSTVQNIQHQTEERLRARLEQQRQYAPVF
jgi:CRP-like cAMP-binding protein